MNLDGRKKEEGKRQGEEERLLRAEAALGMLARVERAPELSEDLRRRIAGTPRRRVGWAWAVAVGVVAVGLGLVTMWPREGEQPRPTGRTQVARQVPPESGSQTLVSDASAQEAAALASGVPGQVAQAMERGGAPPPLKPRRLAALQHRVRQGGEAAARVPQLRSERPHETAVPPEIGLPQAMGRPATALEQTAGAQAHDDSSTSLPSTKLRASRAGLRALQHGGVILVLGRPEPALPSGSCYIAVTSGDGRRTVVDQAVERDAAGRPQMVRLSYDQTEPDAALARQGG